VDLVVVQRRAFAVDDDLAIDALATAPSRQCRSEREAGDALIRAPQRERARGFTTLPDSEPCRGCSIKRIRSIHDHGRYNGESCCPACPDDGRT
jgi:hypothetical protein